MDEAPAAAGSIVLRQAVVQEHQVIAAVTLNDETVFRFEIPMHRAAAMERPEPIEDLDREAKGVIGGGAD